LARNATRKSRSVTPTRNALADDSLARAANRLFVVVVVVVVVDCRHHRHGRDFVHGVQSKQNVCVAVVFAFTDLRHARRV
jgi:hypothetical protein